MPDGLYFLGCTNYLGYLYGDGEMSARGGLTNQQMEAMNFFNIMNTSILQARYRQLMDKQRVGALTERDKEVLERIMDELIDRGA